MSSCSPTMICGCRWVALWGSLLLLTACGSTPTAPPEDEAPGLPHAGIAWTEVDGNPVLAQPACPAWNCLGMTDPWLGTGPDGQVVLWTSAGGSAAEGGPVVGRATGLSPDALTFDADAPQLTPRADAWDRWRETVSLQYDAAARRWRMWYLGYNNGFFQDPGLGQALSEGPDGVRFPRPAAPIYRPEPGMWDGQFVTDPVSLRAPDGTWHLYYVGAGTTIGVGLLTSTDGQNWTPHPENPIFERNLDGWDQGFVGLEVACVDGQYLMWYAGYEEPLDLETTPISIGLATSDDGIHWTRYEDNPVITPGPPGAWNGLRVVAPSVHVTASGALVMAVHGQSAADATGASLGRIGLYRSEPPADR